MRRSRADAVAFSLAFGGFVLGSAAACGDLKNADGSAVDASGGAPDGAPEGAALVDAGGDGAVCTEATCQAEVFQQALYGPVSVAVDLSYVYWIEVGTTIPNGNQHGQLVRVAKPTDCKSRSCYEVIDPLVQSGELEGQEIFDTRLALGTFDVCYTQSFNAIPQHSIRCFSIGGLTKTAIDDGAGDVVDLWIGSTDMRWVVGSSTSGAADGLVQGRPLAAGPTKTFASARPGPTSVTSDGADTFWTELGASVPFGTIDTLASDGGVTSLYKGRSDPGSARLYATYLYWIEQPTRRIMRAPTDGSSAPEEVATTDEAPFDLAVDPTGVYWASAGPGKSGLYGSVAHAPLAPGGKVTTMLANIDKVSKIALDATHVYIASTGTNLDAGRIVRIKKSGP